MFMSRAVTHNELKNPLNSKKKTFKKYLPNYILLLPFVILYLLFTLYPLIQGFYVSFFNWKLLQDNTFVGYGNYIKIFSDPVFYRALRNTVLFVVFSTPVIVIAGLALALIVNQPFKGRGLYRVIFFAPLVLAVSVIASIWQAVLGTYGGLVNSILGLFGVSQLFWLHEPLLAWISIIFVTLWWTVGFNMILYLAGLQDIPDEYYEAAKIDGANPLHRLIYITIPSLKRITVLVLFLQVISGFKVFAQVYLITRGGPAGSTRTLIQYIYEEAFQSFHFGPAAAMSYVLFIVLLVVSMIQLRLSQEKG
jgi:multiple sugar transport system permease protein